MDFIKEAEKYLVSSDSVDVQKGLGYAILAQVEALRTNAKTTLNSRKPEQGDVKVLFCHHCGKDTQCSLEVEVFDLDSGKGNLVWRCLGCGKRLKNKKD